MKALLSMSAGGPETLVLSDIPEPKPGPGEVLIRVRACGVNYPDALMIADRYQFKPARPFAPGGEVAGEVEAVGAGVRDLVPGQRVIALLIWGGMAEKIVAKASACVPLPATMSFEEGAAFLVTYATALYGLRERGTLKADEHLLILGAAGGVGLATIQVAKALGARVTAAVSSPEKAALAKTLGADQTLIYAPGPFDGAALKALANQFKTAAGPKGFDAIFDIVGGDYAEAALRAIGWYGRLLIVGFPAGIPKLALNLVLLKCCQVIGVFYGAFAERAPESAHALLHDLGAMYEQGLLKPPVSQTFPLAEGSAAICALAERRAAGKLIVTIP